MRFLVWSIFALFCTLTAQASDWVYKGNGGDAVYCLSQQGTWRGTRVTFFDLFESQIRYKLNPQFPNYTPISQDNSDDAVFYQESDAQKQQVLEIVGKLITRLKALDPQRASQYATWVSSFYSEANFISGHLADIKDVGIGIYQEGCTLKQLIVQNPTPNSEYDFRYFVDQSLWLLMFPEDKAAAILHEVVYRGALQANPSIGSSEQVRLFVALIVSDTFANKSADEYAEQVKKLGL